MSDATEVVDEVLWIVFGGSCFMGRCLLRELARDGGRAIVLNRGTEYWGSDVGTGSSQIRHVPLDWDAEDVRRAALGASLERRVASLCETAPRVILCVGFSFDEAEHAELAFAAVQQAVAKLPASKKRFVVVSSDSAYDERSVATLRRKAGLQPEMGLREDAGALLRKGSGRTYGLRKAAIERRAEECVSELAGIASWELSFLRLPDVVGPFDDSSRWWATRLWGAAEPHRCYLPSRTATLQVSIVFADDVVRVLRAIARRPTPMVGAFHVVTATLPLVTLVQGVLRQTSASPCKPPPTIVLVRPHVVHHGSEGSSPSDSSSSSPISSDDEADTCDFYPSVSIGPIDGSKLKRALGMDYATPIEHVFAATNAFFDAATEAVGCCRNCVEPRPEQAPRWYGAPPINEYRRALRKLPRWVRLAQRYQKL